MSSSHLRSSASNHDAPKSSGADPTALALTGFSSVVMMISARYSGLIDSISWVSPLGTVAGISLLLGSWYNFKRGHTLPASNFAVYGAFWLSIAIHMAMEPAADFNGIMTFLRIPVAIYTLYAWAASFYVSKVSLFVMTTLEAKLLLFIVGQLTGRDVLMKVGGCFGMACAAGGYYTSASLLVQPKLCLPLGAAVLRPQQQRDGSARRGHPAKRWISWPARQEQADKEQLEGFGPVDGLPKVAP